MSGDGKFTLSRRFIILFRKRRAAAIDPFGAINAHPVCAIDDRGRGNRMWMGCSVVDREGWGRLYGFSPFAHMRNYINVPRARKTVLARISIISYFFIVDYYIIPPPPFPSNKTSLTTSIVSVIVLWRTMRTQNEISVFHFSNTAARVFTIMTRVIPYSNNN